MKRLLLLALPLMLLAPDTGGGTGTSATPPPLPKPFSKENPPRADDYSPAALQFRSDNPEPADEDKNPKPSEDEKKPEVGTDGHPPHPVFSESEHPSIPKGEPNMEPAPTNFE